MSLYTCSLCAPFCSNSSKRATVHLLHGLYKPDLLSFSASWRRKRKKASYTKTLILRSQVRWPSRQWYWATIVNTVVYQGSWTVHEQAFERHKHESTWLLHKTEFEGTFHPFWNVTRCIKTLCCVKSVTTLYELSSLSFHKYITTSTSVGSKLYTFVHRISLCINANTDVGLLMAKLARIPRVPFCLVLC